GHRLDVAAEDAVGEGVDTHLGVLALAGDAQLLVLEAVAHLAEPEQAAQPGADVGRERQADVHAVAEAGRLHDFALDAGDQRLVYLGVDEHLAQVGDPHQLLALADRLALGDDRLLAAAAVARLLGDVVDDQAVLRGVDPALADLVLDLLVALLLLLVDRLVGLAVGAGLDLLGGRLALGPLQDAAGLGDGVGAEGD